MIPRRPLLAGLLLAPAGLAAAAAPEEGFRAGLAALEAQHGGRLGVAMLDGGTGRMLGTVDAEGSREALRSAFGLSEIQSMAAMDLQLRRVSRHELQKIADARDEVAAQLARLRSSGRHG